MTNKIETTDTTRIRDDYYKQVNDPFYKPQASMTKVDREALQDILNRILKGNTSDFNKYRHRDVMIFIDKYLILDAEHKRQSRDLGLMIVGWIITSILFLSGIW